MQKTSKKEERRILLEEFLRNYEKRGTEFSKKEISDFTGYPVGTISTYFGKYLINYLVHPGTNQKFRSKGIKEFSSEEFQTHMSQKSSKLSDVDTDPKIKKLRQRSLDAFCVAVENYNRITLPNRIEVFCILMANAWELLLKSVLIDTTGLESIFYKGTSRTLSLKDTAEKCFKENDPVRKNIEELSELRDQSIHLLVEELHSPLSRVFQATVLNYNDYYYKKAGKSALPKNKIGLLSLVYDSLDFENEIHIKDEHISPEKIKAFLEQFSQTEKNLSSEKYAIDIKRKLVLTKKESDADITLSNRTNSQPAIIIDRPRQREQTHPFRQTDALNRINLMLKDKSNKVTSHTFQALIQKHEIKQSGHFFASGDFGSPGSYSQALVDKLIDMINTNPQCISEAKEYYAKFLKKCKK